MWIIHIELRVGSEEGGAVPVTCSMNSIEFQLEVLEKLGRVEAKLDTIVGNGQPGRMRLAEDRIAELERSDVRRNVYDRIVTAVIAFAVSAAIALHDHFSLK
jgi:hypothetical protein